MSANKVVQKLQTILDALKIPAAQSIRHTHRRLLLEGGTPTRIPRSGFTVTWREIRRATRLKSWPRFCARIGACR
jgi:hypothetical protein